MKTLLCALVAVLGMAHLSAGPIQVTGSLTAQVKSPNAFFTLNGGIQNLGNSASGTVKLVLWLSAAQFPASGIFISEYQLGVLDAGGQFTDLMVKSPVTLPKVSGEYQLTVLVMEYVNSTSGWHTSGYDANGSLFLENGVVVTGTDWIIPVKPVITPRSRIKPTDQLLLTAKATETLAMLPVGSQVKTKIVARQGSKATSTSLGVSRLAATNYRVTKGVLYNQVVPVGRYYLDYDAIAGTGNVSNSTLTLYFQAPKSGVYMNVAVEPTGRTTTWGIFTYQGKDGPKPP